MARRSRVAAAASIALALLAALLAIAAAFASAEMTPSSGMDVFRPAVEGTSALILGVAAWLLWRASRGMAPRAALVWSVAGGAWVGAAPFTAFMGGNDVALVLATAVLWPLYALVMPWILAGAVAGGLLAAGAWRLVTR